MCGKLPNGSSSTKLWSRFGVIALLAHRRMETSDLKVESVLLLQATKAGSRFTADPLAGGILTENRAFSSGFSPQSVNSRSHSSSNALNAIMLISTTQIQFTEGLVSKVEEQCSVVSACRSMCRPVLGFYVASPPASHID